MWTYVFCTLLTLCLVYVYFLNKRLDESRFQRGPNNPFPSDEAIFKDSEDWRDVNVLEGTEVQEATGKRYLITGANGNFGPYLVSLLHDRGERTIYLLDIVPPPTWVAALKGVHYIKCNITSRASVQAAFKEARPDV